RWFVPSSDGSRAVGSACTTTPKQHIGSPRMSVLELQGISIRFGGLMALDDVSLTVNEWEIVGLIGPNGAGKTTLFNCVTGFYRPQRGRDRYRGEDVTDMTPHRKAA